MGSEAYEPRAYNDDMGAPVTRRSGLEVVRLDEVRRAREPNATDRLVRRMIVVGFALLVVGALIQGTSGLVNNLAFDSAYNQLNPDGEGNAFSWASASAAFVAGFVAVLLCLSGRYGRRLLVLGAILVFFSLDDTVRIHETGTYKAMGAIGGIDHRLLWPILLLPLLATAFLLLWRFAGAVGSPADRLLRTGLGLLVAAVALEVSALPIEPQGDAVPVWPYALEVALEEGAELAGWILIAVGLTTVLVRALAPPFAPTARPTAARARSAV